MWTSEHFIAAIVAASRRWRIPMRRRTIIATAATPNAKTRREANFGPRFLDLRQISVGF